jgi:hypothetical protein
MPASPAVTASARFDDRDPAHSTTAAPDPARSRACRTPRLKAADRIPPPESDNPITPASSVGRNTGLPWVSNDSCSRMIFVRSKRARRALMDANFALEDLVKLG